MRRTRPVYGLLVATSLWMAACGERPQEAAERQPAERILTLAPSVAEIAFSLGLGERVVGVGDYCRWPPEIADKPRVGGLFNPNLEAMVSLRPQLAILLPSEGDLGSQLSRLGVEILTVRSETIADLEESITAIAQRCGVEARGRQLVGELEAALAPRAVGEGMSVLISVGRGAGSLSELRVAGPDTFLSELILRLGARNAFGDLAISYPMVSLEEVLARSPDVIFELSALEASPGAQQELRHDWLAFPQIEASRAGRIYVFSGDFTVVPGPRLPRLYGDMARALGDTDRDLSLPGMPP